MNLQTGIQWTDATSNPIRFRDKTTGQDVWACVMTSPGCANCYAQSSAARFGRGKAFTRENMATVDPDLSPTEVRKLLLTKKLAGKKCFIGDMTDVFGDWVPDDMLDALFGAFALRPDVTFQVLTKRADRMAAYLADPDRVKRVAEAAFDWLGTGTVPGHLDDAVARHILFSGTPKTGLRVVGVTPWPLANVWVGVSVENQDMANRRIPPLLLTPAAVRFLSLEPLLGPVDLRALRIPLDEQSFMTANVLHQTDSLNKGKPPAHIAWGICGGESGRGARSFDLAWARDLRDQFAAERQPFFFKQMGDNVTQYGGLHNVRVRHKGGELEDIPEDLRIRQFPAAEAAA